MTEALKQAVQDLLKERQQQMYMINALEGQHQELLLKHMAEAQQDEVDPAARRSPEEHPF